MFVNEGKRSFKIAKFAMILAIVFVGITIDTLISGIFSIRPAFASLLTVVTVCLLFGFLEAFVAGTFFGVLSLVRAYLFPTLTSPLFMYPLVSIVPRIAVGIVIWASLKGFSKIFSRSGKDFVRNRLAYHIAGGLGAVTNTLLVILAMGVYNVGVLNSVISVITGALFPIELAISALVAPIVALGVKRAIK
ncbi:MAG: hypothetical protein ACI4S9_01970 [Christensenellales bacterium]